MKALHITIFFLILFATLNSFASSKYKYEDKGQLDPDFDCELKSFQNKKWANVDSKILNGLIFPLQYKKGNTRPYAKIKDQWITAKSECFILQAEQIPVQKKISKSVSTNANYLYSIGLIYFSQTYTTTSTTKKDYSISGTLIGVNAGIERAITQFSGIDFGAGADLFAGLMSAKVDTSTTPKPNFSYSAKNYLEYGLNVYPFLAKDFLLNTAEKSKSKIRLAFQPGLGISFVSLPAPVTSTLKYSAPPSNLIYYFAQVSGSYFLKPDLGFSLNLGFMQSISNLMIKAGICFKL